jgi:ParB-like chromosome segregation protein Spo0J
MSDTLRHHPLADIFPLMEGAEFDELVADIKANGLIEPIILLDDQILDGRNRARACVAAGVEPTYRPFTAGEDPAAFVISANIRRRHLNTEQKRELIEKLLKADASKSNVLIAKTTGVTDKTVGSVRAALEATSEIPRLEKTVGADGKARKRPQSRTARRRARFDRMKERAARERTEAAAGTDAATAIAAPDSNPITCAWDKASRTQRHEFIMARKLEVMRAQQQIGKPAYEVEQEQADDAAAPEIEVVAPTVAVDSPAARRDRLVGRAARMRQEESTGAPEDPFEIPPMFDRTGGAP